MKKILSIMLVALMLVGTLALGSCGASNTIIVQTNAYFAPFEYLDGGEVKGVDVEIMNKVGEKLGKTVEFKNVEFSVIIDNVSAGKICDAGAAGITITDARKEKVDFSIPYYTSVQYVIFAADDAVETKTVDGVEYIVWEALAGKVIGTQTDTTGWIYTDGEINAQESDPDYGYNGVLYGTNTTMKSYDTAQIAADAIGTHVDYVIIDELPAQYIVAKNSGLKCLPLYYTGTDGEADAPVEEEYAICVTKGNTALLTAINEVLEELLVEGENGKTKVEELVMKHMGLDG
ncbi:MAG: transporter substrate-binding domain-containing protein [Clostridia bacterium]|nr:transporter substrate-binding domain-containing protein [Clostridia bacterium]